MQSNIILELKQRFLDKVFCLFLAPYLARCSRISAINTLLNVKALVVFRSLDLYIKDILINVIKIINLRYVNR